MVARVPANGAHHLCLTFPAAVCVAEPQCSRRVALRLQQQHSECRHQNHTQGPEAPVHQAGNATRRLRVDNNLPLPEFLGVLAQKPVHPFLGVFITGRGLTADLEVKRFGILLVF